MTGNKKDLPIHFEYLRFFPFTECVVFASECGNEIEVQERMSGDVIQWVDLSLRDRLTIRSLLHDWVLYMKDMREKDKLEKGLGNEVHEHP